MKGGLALLVLVVVAGLAECMPRAELRERLQARVAELRAKGKGKQGKGKEDKGEDDMEWPRGWIEFASLVGRCETARNWLEILEMEAPEEGVLAEACPKAYEGCEQMQNATDEELQEVHKFMTKIFPLLQCVNLQAEKEELAVALFVNGKNLTEDVFMKETAPLFTVCYNLFESVEAEIEELNKDVNEVEETVNEERRDAQIKSLIRQLIHTASKKR